MNEVTGVTRQEIDWFWIRVWKGEWSGATDGQVLDIEASEGIDRPRIPTKGE